MKNISLREGKNLWDWFFMTGTLDRLVLEALVKLVIVGVWYDMLEVRLGLKSSPVEQLVFRKVYFMADVRN